MFQLVELIRNGDLSVADLYRIKHECDAQLQILEEAAQAAIRKSEAEKTLVVKRELFVEILTDIDPKGIFDMAESEDAEHIAETFDIESRLVMFYCALPFDKKWIRIADGCTRGQRCYYVDNPDRSNEMAESYESRFVPGLVRCGVCVNDVDDEKILRKNDMLSQLVDEFVSNKRQKI